MAWETLVVALFAWNVFGNVLCIAIANKSNADGWELCNPYWVYQYNKKVNWFGAILLALFYNLACPVGAICYWFYKLCTVGRD